MSALDKCAGKTYNKENAKESGKMAKIDLQGTEFIFSVLPLKFLSKGFWARTEICLKNEHVFYNEIGENVSREALEEWIFCMFRLLAGAYGEEYSLSFEKAGLAVDFYPYTENGSKVSRELRRKNDCVMAIRLLMRGADKKSFLGGVYTLMLHRKEIEIFATILQQEFNQIFDKRVPGRGKYLFVGVSPLGYKGCNYWYLDPLGKTEKGDYVWVRMGRRSTEQIVFVDSVRYFSDDTAPYPPESVRRVLRKATKEEMEKIEKGKDNDYQI